MKNVINNNDEVAKVDSKSDKAIPLRRYGGIYEAIVTMVWESDKCGFYMQEMLKTLELIGHDVDEHQMDPLREFYKYYSDRQKRYDAIDEFFTYLTIDEVANFYSSFCSFDLLFELFYRLHSETLKGGSANLFTLRAYGELVKKIIENYGDYLYETIPTPLDLNEKGPVNPEWNKLSPIDLDGLSEDLKISKDEIMTILEVYGCDNCEDDSKCSGCPSIENLIERIRLQ
jgi:hypothetical protein